MVRKLSKKVLRNFPGVIWNIELNALNNLMALEIRNRGQKNTSFYIYDLSKQIWVWEEVEFEENWWLQLQGIDDEYVYLNYFTNKENPDSKKIIKVSVEKMEVEAELPQYEMAENKSMQLPFHYLVGTDNFEKVAAYIKQHNGAQAVKAVDYLQTDSAIAISYYLYQQEKMANFLLILNEKGEELESEVLTSEIEKVGMHTFFSTGNFLIAIKENTKLLIYTL